MAKVKLNRSVGDYPAGTELEINDKTVIEAWEKLGVIGGKAPAAKKEEGKAENDKK
ncbi:hypothetical protein [Elizabethkingia anophelis]|uniref:hypothetical protein n=1 Tax=Elizabethkingia anophelis TaxID=1117645 RepID=UPI0021A548B0|nr:hypothetical protein [Elizabethkingia anophelis]MCT4090928.1 hypothetical protein [Elizabethkingia anophelis]